jgi:hypothetical protein
MLRLAVLLLLLANAGYYAWSQGLLAAAGLEPARQTEPQRLRQQIKPEAVRIIPVDEARRIESTAAAPAAQAAECLQAGPFEEGQVAGLRQALASWPAGSWSLEPTVEPARWIVYMGQYPTPENVSRKKAELRQMGIFFEALSNPSLEPGLSLGGFPSQAGAMQQMDALAQRGVHTAKVVQERPELHGQLLKLPAADDKLRARLQEIRPALGGKNLRPCR